MLPQDLFAEALWMEWFMYYGVVSNTKIQELLRRYNLKPKRGKTNNDVGLTIGRACKGTFGNSKLLRERIAEEVDKVCIIARWDFAVGKYK